MYALSFSAEGDCNRCVPPDLGIAAAAGTPPGIAPAAALHTFTLDSGASRCLFRDSTTLTPLPAPVPVRLADRSGGPVVARSFTVLPCPAVSSGSLSGLHLPSFSTNLSLYTLATEPPQVAASAQVSASCQVTASCSCRLLSHQTLLWHQCLGHPSLPRLRGMHPLLLVCGLPRSLPPLPPSPTPPCLPCVEGRQRAAPHSSSFPPTTAPLQTLHMDVKGEVSAVLIPWIRMVCLQLRERFGQDLPILRLHSDRGDEFSSDLLRDFYHGEGITQSFTLPDSPQQNGIAECRIGLVMEVARTSMIHAAAPHFLWPFAVRYAAHQLNLWPRVSLPETSPTLRWTGKVGNASVFRSVPFYRLFPYRSAPPPPPPLFLAPSSPPVDPLPPQGPAPPGVSQVDPLPGTAPVQVAVVSGAAPGASSGGAASGDAVSGGAEPGGAGSEGAGSGGAEHEGVELGGAESEGAEPGGAASEGADFGGAEPRGAASFGGPAGASPPLSSQLREWLVQRAHRRSGAPGGGEPGDTGAGGGAVTAGAGDPTEPGAAGARGPGVLGVHSSTSPPPPFLCPPPDHSWQPLQPVSPLPVPSPYTEQPGGLVVRRELASRPVLPVRTACRAPRSRPPPLPGMHTMALRPSTVPLRVFLPAPPESSLPEVPDPESDRARATSPTGSCVFTIAVNDPSFESAAASALDAELLDFAAACRLDYASAIVAESASAKTSSVEGECALGTDVFEDSEEDFECLAATVPPFASLLLALEGDPDAPHIPTPRS
ncbi:unnamed protein product [Closterium sp. NIES-54]